MTSVNLTDKSLVAPPRVSAGAALSQRIGVLDGFRAIAVIIVFVGHYAVYLVPSAPVLTTLFPAKFGVNIFFVLSGFLIARLLLREYSKSGEINLVNFYARRLLRLTPALWVFLSIVTLAYYA